MATGISPHADYLDGLVGLLARADATQHKASVATGAMFSLMALLVSQGQILPTVFYLSNADVPIVNSLILVSVAIGGSILTGILAQSGKSDLAMSIDRYRRRVYFLLTVISLGLLLI